MKKINIECALTLFEDRSELAKDVNDLMSQAIEARKNAYAPYSNFQVGAAVLLDNHEVVVGNNQENASYPSGLCAERTAIYYAGARFPKSKIRKIVISAASNSGKTFDPIPPCGACRQAIAEYEIKQNSPIEIYFMGATGNVIMSQSLANILPLVFHPSVL